MDECLLRSYCESPMLLWGLIRNSKGFQREAGSETQEAWGHEEESSPGQQP